jgi:hypothetical protein
MAGTGEGIMAMKKDKSAAIPRLAEGRPAKPSEARAEVPTYDGPEKSDEQQVRLHDDLPAKEAFADGGAPAAKPGADHDDQQPPPGPAQPDATAGEQYIRLRVTVRNDQLSVLDSHLVDGPLAQTTGFSGSHAYEITVGDRLLHAGALPDLGVQRSFVNPNGPADQQGHHFTERRAFEFMARVPAHEVTRETISDMAIRLHRIKDGAQTNTLSAAPLGTQFEREIRQVAELVGLPDSVLPEAIEARGARTPSI